MNAKKERSDSLYSTPVFHYKYLMNVNKLIFRHFSEAKYFYIWPAYTEEKRNKQLNTEGLAH